VAVSSSATSTVAPSPKSVQAAKKRAMLKEKKVKDKPTHATNGVLGDADYVSLMMGGRRKAKQEAEKLAARNA